jgi:hypothetical protein
MGKLPDNVKGTDFDNLPVKSLQQVQAAFKKILGNQMGGKFIEIKSK